MSQHDSEKVVKPVIDDYLDNEEICTCNSCRGYEKNEMRGIS